MADRRPDSPAPTPPDATREQTSPPQTHDFSIDRTNPSFGSVPTVGVPGFPFLTLPQAPDEIGRLGDYRILGKLGEGGMGFVFRAEETALRRPVALKVMRPEVAAKAQAADRFLREGRAAAALKSDHIITIYRADSANGVPYLAMEFLEGLPLDAWIKKQTKPVPLAHALRIVKDTLRGLATAHVKGLIHRDVKPANLWIEKGNSRIKLLDFGLTRSNDADMQLTQEGAVVGTPAYMAPEQASGKPVDPRADLFSVGVLLYHLLAGKNPFARKSLMETLGAIGYEVQPPLISVRPDVPKEYSDFADRLLAKLPEGRPAHAKAALAELVAIEKRVQDGGQTLAHSVVVVPVPDAAPQVWGELDFDAAPTERSAIARSGVAPPPAARKDRSALYYGAGFAMFLVALVAITLALTGGGKTNPNSGVTDNAKGNEAKKDVKSSTGVAKKATSKPPMDPDRKAAEFVLLNGGSITIAERILYQKDVDSLPTEPFKIHHILLTTRELSESEAEILFNLDGLKTLGIHFKLTDRNLAKLSKLPAAQSLATLHADIPELTDAGLKLFRNFTAIQDLRLNDVRCSGTGFQDWAGWELPTLQLRLQQGFVEDNLQLLGAMPKLAAVTIHGASFTDVGARRLGGIPSLVDVNFYSTKITNAGIAALETLPKIEYLRVQSDGAPTLTRECLTSAAKMKKLRCLVLDVPLRDADIPTLLSIDSLGEIILNGLNPEFTDAGLESLVGLKSLHILGVSASRITSDGVRKFKAARPTVNLLGELLALADPDRAAAEFVIGRGGSVTVHNVGGVNAIANLPAGPFEIRDINLSLATDPITDADLDRFRDLTKLEQLDLKGTYTDAGIGKLTAFQSKLLHTVNVRSPAITDGACATLAKLPALAQLEIIGSTSFTGRGLAELKGTGLVRLSIVGCLALESAELAKLADLPKLTELHFLHGNLQDEGLRHVGALSGIKILSVYAMLGVTDAGAKHLEKLETLERLHVAVSPFTNVAYESFAKLPKLTAITASANPQVSDAVASALAKSPALMSIGLEVTSIGDPGLAALAECKTLKNLNVHKTKITAAGAAAFRKARPDVVLQCDFPEDNDRKAAETILALGSLVVVRVDGVEKPLRDLDEIAGKAIEVVSVNVNRNKFVNDDTLECLRGLRHLTSAQLTNTAAGDRALECLKDSANLETLILYNSKITDKGLEHLAGFAKLKNLNLTQLPNLSEAAVKALAAKIPQCRIAWNGGSIEPTK
ncbi:MAG: protein kinase [Gemmataceae bacterium]|nr:protein kinase [Gemmataceae bacterium]